MALRCAREKCRGDHVLDKSALYAVALLALRCAREKCRGDHVLDKSALYAVALLALNTPWRNVVGILPGGQVSRFIEGPPLAGARFSTPARPCVSRKCR